MNVDIRIIWVYKVILESPEDGDWITSLTLPTSRDSPQIKCRKWSMECFKWREKKSLNPDQDRIGIVIY